jgi:acetyltransferase-like isoleucine patch superfamily enzyme
MALAEQARQSSVAGKRRGKIGNESVVDFANVSWKPSAQFTVGDRSMIIGACIFEREGATVAFGTRTYFASTISCATEVRVGSDVLVANGGFIADHNSHDVNFAGRCNDVVEWMDGKKDWSNVRIAPVTIEDKVWIGVNVLILRGVIIGEGAVVGAGSVVSRDVPPYTVVAGNPAAVIRTLDRS